MIHTLELSKMISQETFETLINTLRNCRFNRVAWITQDYKDSGISMICLRRFKPRRKDKNGTWITMEDEPFRYIIILSINTGIMFGGDGYRSNEVQTFTPDFAKAVYAKIMEQIPQLEINSCDREKGLEIYWNTGKYPKLLLDYYEYNSFKVRRIDYALDIAITPDQYIQLIEHGKEIHRKSYQRKDYDINTPIEIDLNVDDTEIEEDEEPDFEDMEELLQEYSSDMKYIYYKSKAVNINIYLKGEQLKKKHLIDSDDNTYNFLRIEFQVKKGNLNVRNRRKGIQGRDFHKMAIPELEEEIINYYLKLLTYRGIHYTCKMAKEVIDATSPFGTAKTNRLKQLVELIATEQGIDEALAKIATGAVKEFTNIDTVKSYLRELERMGINPVTISKGMQNTIPKTTFTNNSGGKDLSRVVLPSLLDILDSYSQELKEEQQQGRAYTKEDFKQIDKTQ